VWFAGVKLKIQIISEIVFGLFAMVRAASLLIHSGRVHPSTAFPDGARGEAKKQSFPDIPPLLICILQSNAAARCWVFLAASPIVILERVLSFRVILPERSRVLKLVRLGE